MHDHVWIVEVCQDLKAYAREHQMVHLESELDDAIDAARHDVFLHSLVLGHETVRDCAVLGRSIGFCQHTTDDADDTGTSFSACC